MQPENYPMMFHYLLEMHKDGRPIAKLELDVPISAFPPVRMHLLLGLEAILVEEGKRHGWEREKPGVEETHGGA